MLLLFTALVGDDDDDESNDEDGAAGYSGQIDPIDADDIGMNREGESSNNKAKRGRINWISPRLTSALDYTKTSDTDAMHILAATIDALKQVLDVPADELVLNRTTIHELRKANRQQEAESGHAEFVENVI